MTAQDFVEILASKEPVPGGGGASALAGAVGTALSQMVGSLTLGKKKYAAVEDEVRAAMQKATRLQSELLGLIDKDAEGFAPLAAAYRLPKETEEERAHKEQVMEACLRDACEVPMQIMERCAEAIDLAEFFMEKGSVMAVSDAGASAAILRGALHAASLNITINTASMKDREYAETLEHRAITIYETYGDKADRIVEKVRGNLRKG